MVAPGASTGLRGRVWLREDAGEARMSVSREAAVPSVYKRDSYRAAPTTLPNRYALAGATDLRLVHLEDITLHYTRTLREWRRRFFAQIERVREMGYSDTFIRMWEYYLCYCEGGFAERYIGDVQMIFAKPMWRKNDAVAN